MKFINTEIEGLLVVEPKVFGDHRGYFFESYNQREFEKKVGYIQFVQDNESLSSRGVVRGLHFQKPPFDQAKLVRCIHGEVLDVAVDLRKNSPTFGQHFSIKLSSENKKKLFVPRGFAHGFAVLSDKAIFAYKVDNWYSPEHDSGIKWNDKDLNINWGLNSNEFKISEKDQNLTTFCELDSPFKY